MDIIFDVDGTLMNINHRRHFVERKPSDWPAFHAAMPLDVPNLLVCHAAIMYMAAGHTIIITTGRYENARQLTADQLRKAGVMFDVMLMRPDGDSTQDAQLKRGMLNRLHQTGYNPKIAFDDRDRVVEMWREAGLQCFQVAKGDF